MQIFTSDESSLNFSENSQVEGDTHTRYLTASPTASLELCEHCGEEYCTDAEVGIAQAARMYKATTVLISYSAPSTPAKPLRKKRKLDSLVSRAKEQAVPDARLKHSSAIHAMTTKPENSMTKAAEQKAEHEKLRKLKLQIPTEDFAARDFALPQHVNSSQADQDSSFGMDPTTPERRKLDELHEGVRIVYKRKSPAKSSSRLSFLRRN